MKKGFTLLELIVVIIIIGILGAFAFTQYTRVIEKGRSAEARNNLGTLRKLQLAHYQENGSYAGNELVTQSNLPRSCSNSNFYFYYACDTNGSCSAARCDSGGKPPAASEMYWLELSIAGQWTGTQGAP